MKGYISLFYTVQTHTQSYVLENTNQSHMFSTTFLE